MTLTEVLLILLILAVLYTAYILRKRVSQMEELKGRVVKEKQEMEQAMKEVDPMLGEPQEPAIAVLRVRPPGGGIIPEVTELEHELDKLWETRPLGRGEEIAEKEKEIIGKMVEIFAKKADAELISTELKSHVSGSK